MQNLGTTWQLSPHSTSRSKKFKLWMSFGVKLKGSNLRKQTSGSYIGPDHSHCDSTTFEPPHGKTENLHMRKQRRRSASR